MAVQGKTATKERRVRQTDKQVYKDRTSWSCRVNQEVRKREIGKREKKIKVCKDQSVRSGEMGRRIKHFVKTN